MCESVPHSGWEGAALTRCLIVTTQPEFTVRPMVGVQTENTGCVVFSMVAPTC